MRGGSGPLGRSVAASIVLAAIAALVSGAPEVAPLVLALSLSAATLGIGASALVRAPARRRPSSSPGGPGPVPRLVGQHPPAVIASPPQFSVQVFTRSKLDAPQEENEDAAAVDGDGRIVAVSDGASSAFASSLWSRQLVDGFVTRNGLLPAGERVAFVADCAAAWERLTRETADASWWEDAARQKGSFAAFVGLTIDEAGAWKALAVGDCCVFVTRNDQMVRSFPIERADHFNSTPSLLTTVDPGHGEWQEANGQLDSNDVMLVASDGIAAWLLTKPEDRLAALLDTSTDLTDLVDRERKQQRMENDDVTLVTVRVRSDGG